MTPLLAGTRSFFLRVPMLRASTSSLPSLLFALCAGTAIALLAALLAAGCRCGPEPLRPCDTTEDCPDDGLYCTAPLECVRSGAAGVCLPQDAPCPAGFACDEATHDCTPIPGFDGGPDAPPSCDERTPGTACSGLGTCGPASECQEAWVGEFATASGGLPGRTLPVHLFPGGSCAVRCDARRLNDECAPCASCSAEALAGRTRLPLYYFSTTYEPGEGVCRERCTPSRESSGCARPGYTCDLETSTCMEGCVDDRQCQIVPVDLNGDGAWELVDRGASFPASCDRATGRCRTRGTPGARVGDPCTDDTDCEDDGVCLRDPGAPAGICSRLGCRAPGFECPEGAGCDVRNVGGWGTSGCLVSCAVGAEEGTPAMRGTGTGGHPECGVGRACVWNGLAERDAPEAGSCVIGAYSDRAAPSVGEPCRSVADCDSPFGYGECLFSDVPEVGHGICTVQHCATFLDASGATVEGLLPGVALATPICDPARGEVCVNLGARDEPAHTLCLEGCDDAAACAPGYACTEVLGGERFCWPYCYDDGECRTGARCETTEGEPCLASGGTCFCSDRTPR